MGSKHSHYFKDVADLDEVDVYMVCELFGVQDSSGATQHALKKLLLPGQRGAGKGLLQDLKEARDSIIRRIAILEFLEKRKGAVLSQMDQAAYEEMHAAVVAAPLPVEPAGDTEIPVFQRVMRSRSSGQRSPEPLQYEGHGYLYFPLYSYEEQMLHATEGRMLVPKHWKTGQKTFAGMHHEAIVVAYPKGSGDPVRGMATEIEWDKMGEYRLATLDEGGWWRWDPRHDSKMPSQLAKDDLVLVSSNSGDIDRRARTADSWTWYCGDTDSALTAIHRWRYANPGPILG